MRNGYCTHQEVEHLKKAYPKGTRVQLIEMEDPYTKLQPGERGTVMAVDDIGTVHVQWDSGSTLGLCYGVDRFCVILERFIENLEELCRRKGISIRECAESIHVTEVRFCRIIHGEREPNEVEIANLCTYFGVSRDQLLGDLPEPPEPPKMVTLWARIGISFEVTEEKYQELLARCQQCGPINGLPTFSDVDLTEDEMKYIIYNGRPNGDSYIPQTIFEEQEATTDDH